MRTRVYIETSIVSYLTAKPSHELIIAAHQQVTRDWWETQRGSYDLYTSQFVIDEAGDGDSDAAKARLEALSAIPLVPLTPESVALGKELVKAGLLPRKAGGDATHLGVAIMHNMNVLLTWNCTHLANAVILGRIGRFLNAKGLYLPIVCTPEELMGDPGVVVIGE